MNRMRMNRTFFLFLATSFLLILFSDISAQQVKPSRYIDWWKKIDTLVQIKGLYRSALTEVNALYKKASVEKEDAQVIKALVYRLEIQDQLEEFSDTMTIAALQKEIRISKPVPAAILHTLLAEYYKELYNHNRWEIYERTTTINFQKENIRSWGAVDFHNAIRHEFKQALKDPSLLQSTSLAKFDPVIQKGNARNLRPTLFDLLAWKAIDYYQAGAIDIPSSAADELIQVDELLSPANKFVSYEFKVGDSSNHQFQAILLYQQLIRFHLTDKNQDALADADLNRLQFARNLGSMAEKKSAYRNALETCILNYKGTATSDQAGYLLAREYSEMQPAENVKAIEILAAVTEKKKETEGYVNAYNLLQQLKQATIGMSTEKVNIPGQPFRTLLEWKNLSKVYLRLYKVNPQLKEILTDQDNYFDTDQWKLLLQQKSIRDWEQAVPLTTDYRAHSAEIKVDALTVGQYILLAADQPDFTIGSAFLAAQYFHVSNISYINRGNDFFILNRDNGQPFANAMIQLWHRKYDNASRKNVDEKGSRYTSNDKGFITITGTGMKNNYNVRLEITVDNDYLFLNNEQYIYVNNPLEKADQGKTDFEKKNSSVYFFTDRSIYRPGQQINFKGIAVTKDQATLKSRIYSGQKSTVYLLNTNGEKVDSITVTSNDYGSYAGQFKLSESGLTGIFRLEDNTLHGTAYFHVEEYKRPKFQVEYQPVKGSFRLNDSVTVSGFAKAYTGNPIGNASLTYRITRRARFIYPWAFAKRPFVPRNPTEISNGRLITNADGSFSLRFKAVPDEEIDPKTKPVFDFFVEVNVTDLNGETRSAEIAVPVSYLAVQLKIEGLEEQMVLDSFHHLRIITQNITGEFEPAKVNVAIHPLVSPGRLVRKRFWKEPDQFILTEVEFIKFFPYDEYRSETDPQNWTKGQPTWEKTFTATEDGKLAIDKKLVSGWYLVTALTVDRYGDTVKNQSTVFLYDPNEKKLPVPSYLNVIQDKQIIQPGEKAIINIGSSADDLFVIQQKVTAMDQGEKNDQPFSSRFSILTIDQSVYTQTITATETDRGGMGITHFFVKNNRFYSAENSIAVPWLNKELDIKVETYRDKTLPGAEEKWTVSIRGKKGEKVAAELLTSMYDASLDQFSPHNWEKPAVWPFYWNSLKWNSRDNFLSKESTVLEPALQLLENKPHQYDELFGFDLAPLGGFQIRGKTILRQEGIGVVNQAGTKDEGIVTAKYTSPSVVNDEKPMEGDLAEDSIGQSAISIPPTRKDFRETAFFFPQLNADDSGNYRFSFNMPEALTTWKWQLLAHSKDLSFGSLNKTVITRKDLMVQPNMPRFLREGDRMELSTKIVNLSDKELTGQAELQLIDASTNQPVDGWFRNFFPNQYFTVAPGGTELVKFPMEVPYQFDKPLTWRIIARSGNFSDGEEASLPVLSNRQLVTETLPFFINGSGTKKYSFDKLISSGKSETLSNRSLTVEFSSNPAWYAVQALSYLSEYPYECAEQSFNRLYANLLAANIINRIPKIKSVLEKWNAADTSALLSNLQKNQSLKQVLLEETPWVLQAKSEEEQKRQIAQLFNLVQLSANRTKLAAGLLEMQTENGGFSWFKGGPDDRFITQYIVTGIGHLKQLGAIPNDLTALTSIVEKALPYLDARIKEDYNKRDKKITSPASLNYYAVQYLYMRSLFLEKALPGTILPAATFYRKDIQQNWIKGNRMAKAMIALTLFRSGDKFTAQNIIKSLEQSAINNEEMGMYWKDKSAGFYWQDAPVETQALLIEAFSLIKGNPRTTGALKAWLLRNKETNHWTSTKATADACYSLLLNGENWLEAEPVVSVQLGTVTTVRADKVEAGTGFYQKQIPGTAVFPEMGNVTLKVEQPVSAKKELPVWGAVYWQYFEDLDKITTSASPLKIQKQVMIEQMTKTGPVLEPVTEGTQLKIGDKLKVRLELSSDRSMEYVHLKDMRASTLEPVNVISGYKWQGGLGYYETTRDASTSFFISYLPKGTYVIEYALFVSHAGVFSNGISSVQCMYAPAFSSHSEGIKLQVE
jgi:uncharacterized protein YfaS (alpha-2-macroglobulin family)